jgi:hypothetical protein
MNPRVMSMVGWAMSVIIALMMGASAVMKFAAPQMFRDNWVGPLGWPLNLATPIGVVELACVLLFVIPRTSFFGAVLLTGYLGGAIASHVRINEQFIAPALLGVFVWIALALRDGRLRTMLFSSRR